MSQNIHNPKNEEWWIGNGNFANLRLREINMAKAKKNSAPQKTMASDARIPNDWFGVSGPTPADTAKAAQQQIYLNAEEIVKYAVIGVAIIGIVWVAFNGLKS